MMRGMPTTKQTAYCGQEQQFLLDMGQRFAKLRTKRGMKIKDAAAGLKTTYNTVLRWESAVVAIPWDKALAYCGLLQCRLRDVLPRGA